MNGHPNIKCEQKCGKVADVYAIDPIPNGWGGHYCYSCADALKFRIIDDYNVMFARTRDKEALQTLTNWIVQGNGN